MANRDREHPSAQGGASTRARPVDRRDDRRESSGGTTKGRAMRQRRRSFVALGAMGAALAISAMAVPSADAAPSVKVLLDGLTSPKGITMQTDGFDPVVGQGAFGGQGPVLVYTTRHGKGQTIPLTDDQAAVVDIAASPDGTGWAIGVD